MHSDLTDLHKLRRLLGLADNAGVGEMLGAVDRLLMRAAHREVYEPGPAAATAVDEGWARQIRTHIETEHEVALDPDLAAIIEEHVAAALARARDPLMNLLARIHGDGGHYTTLRGLDKSVADADRIVSGLHARVDEARTRCHECGHPVLTGKSCRCCDLETKVHTFIAAGLAGEDGQPRKVLGKPWYTKDRAMITVGCTCYTKAGVSVRVRTMHLNGISADHSCLADRLEGTWTGGPQHLYSTPEAAQAAAAEREGGKPCPPSSPG